MFALIRDAAALGRPGRHRLRPGVVARRPASLPVPLDGDPGAPAYIFATARFDHLRLRGIAPAGVRFAVRARVAVVSWAWYARRGDPRSPRGDPAHRRPVHLSPSAPPCSSSRTPWPSARRWSRAWTLPWVIRGAAGRFGRRDRTATRRRRPGAAGDRRRRAGRAGAATGGLEPAPRAPGCRRDDREAVRRPGAVRDGRCGVLDPSSADELVPDQGLRPEAVSGVTSALRTGELVRRADPRPRGSGPRAGARDRDRAAGAAHAAAGLRGAGRGRDASRDAGAGPRGREPVVVVVVGARPEDRPPAFASPVAAPTRNLRPYRERGRSVASTSSATTGIDKEPHRDRHGQ